MSGNNVILDTNIVLYILGGKYDVSNLPEGNCIISFVTEIELLSYPLLNLQEERKIKNFLDNIDVVGIDQKIKEKTIHFRKKYKLKIPDAIVCATSYCKRGVLVTKDKDLKKVLEVNINF